MELKATLKKPYTDIERADFIVLNNYTNGYEIQETDKELQAWGMTEEEIAEDEKRRNILRTIQSCKDYLAQTDYVVIKISEAIAAEDAELVSELKTQYAEVLAKRIESRNTIQELEN